MTRTGGDRVLLIRSETVADYSAIAALHYETFLATNPENGFVVEPLMVDLLRHNETFDPELSIVAELDGRVVGHTLFSPFAFTVLGETLPGVMVAPVAVHPVHQGLKIGAGMMAEGHRRAAEKGYALALLCGHPDYYPRFGYLTSVYALSGTRLMVNVPEFDATGWTERPLRPTDLDWINAGWARLHANDGLAVNPGTALSQWMGHGPAVKARVLTKDGEPMAYVRYSIQERVLRVREIVPAHGQIDDALAFLTQQFGPGEAKLILPLPASTIRLDWAPSIEDVAIGRPPFMIKPLTVDGPINRYCEQVLAGALKPGIIVFPAIFDIEG
jgi:putative acetyltransferase